MYGVAKYGYSLFKFNDWKFNGNSELEAIHWASHFLSDELKSSVKVKATPFMCESSSIFHVSMEMACLNGGGELFTLLFIKQSFYFCYCQSSKSCYLLWYFDGAFSTSSQSLKHNLKRIKREKRLNSCVLAPLLITSWWVTLLYVEEAAAATWTMKKFKTKAIHFLKSWEFVYFKDCVNFVYLINSEFVYFKISCFSSI